MIVGSGMLAEAFSAAYSQRQDVCIYAAGVSNSGCTSEREFARERDRLASALRNADHVAAFVYFGTCSVADPEAMDAPYVRHKLAMEQMVGALPHHLILRLPNVAGRTPNPHTLLNYLYARISRSEAFSLWSRAKRNIIDVDDVVAVAKVLIKDTSRRDLTHSIANPMSYSLSEIVTAFEHVVGKRAIFEVIERGSEYPIDIAAVTGRMEEAGVRFGESYLMSVIAKYYKNPYQAHDQVET